MVNIKHLLGLSLVAVSVLLFSAFALNGARPSAAAVTTWDTPMRTAEENPPVNYPGSGFARFTFDDTTRVLTYAVTISGISPNLITAAHIHRGAVGVNGPIIYPLSTGGQAQFSGSITLTEADVADLRAGNLYINAHSVDFPGGFARGQMYVDPAAGIKATVNGAIDSWNKKDITRFIGYFTDNALFDSFGVTRAQAPGVLSQFIGEPQISLISLTNLAVADRTATGNLQLGFGVAIQRTLERFILDGTWKIDDETDAPVPVPAGVTPVDLKLQEFAFVYDKTQAAKGNIAFNVSNVGKQEHEVVLVKVAAGIDLQKALQSSGPDSGPPPGIDDVAQAGPFEPGDQTSIVFTQPLSAGRYALLCFVPDTDGIPHALKGMVSEFTVGASTIGTISPPNTGDGGLLGASSNAGYALLALAIVSLSLGGGLIVSARARD